LLRRSKRAFQFACMSTLFHGVVGCAYPVAQLSHEAVNKSP
jgi:hypothetical protein